MNLVDLLLPGTDAGVLAQLAIVAGLAAAALWRFRRHSEGRLIVVGPLLMSLGFVGVRALH